MFIGRNPEKVKVARTWKMMKVVVVQDLKEPMKMVEGFIPEGQSIIQAYYMEILKRLHEAVRRKRPELWPNIGFSIMTMLQLTRRSLSSSF
jgi:hypothetical protein